MTIIPIIRFSADTSRNGENQTLLHKNFFKLTMKRTSSRFLPLLATVFLSLAAFFSLSGCSGEPEPQRDYYGEITSVKKLILAKMSISKMASIDDLKLSKAKGMRQSVAAFIDALKIGDRKAAYSYNTYMRAYIDLNELTPEDITITDNRIEVNLPSPKTEFYGRDIPIREEHYRVTGLRSAVDARDRAELKEKINTALKHEVVSNKDFAETLKATAKTKAKAYFMNLLQEEGKEIVINFKN